MRVAVRVATGFSLLLAAACAHQVSVRRADGAPQVQPSARVEAVVSAPPGAAFLGTVTVQSNNHQTGAECEAQALYEAKKLGATHAIIRPANAGWGKGPKCTGDAYYVAPR